MARFTIVDREGVRDGETGLVWERCPAGDPLPWPQALEADEAGWRLPGIDALMAFLLALRDDHPCGAQPEPGVWWSASRSPFAPSGWARAVETGTGRGPAVVLREVGRAARRWRVRG